jgi:hypothetical protein
MRSRLEPLTPALLGLALAAWLAAAAAAQDDLPAAAPSQIEEEELLEPQPAPAGGEQPALDVAAAELLYAEARAALQADDQPSALLLFGQVVDAVDAHLQQRLAAAEVARAAAEAAARAAGGETELPAEAASEPAEPAPEVRFLEPEVRDLLVETLGYRAWIQLGFGEEDLARRSLERMLTIDPGADVDREAAPAELVQLGDRLRQRLVGGLRRELEPPDAVVTVDGRRVDPAAGPVSALSGRRRLEVERVGYAPLAQEIEVTAGRQSDYQIALERTSPVLRLHTRPAGAEVRVDGEPAGVTEGTAAEDFLRHGSYRREEFSAELVLAGVEPGLRVLQVEKDGYRSYRSELVIDELVDYPMPPIVLVREAGVLVFHDLPADARIVVDGQPVQVDDPGASRPRLTLAPGEHEVQISSSASRMFASRFLLADRQTIDVNVRLLPGVAFLGILGRGGEAAESLARSLKVALGDAGKWAVLDRSREGPAVLAAAGATAAALVAESDVHDALELARGTASLPPPARPGGVDWRRVQQAVDRQAPGMLYVAAVLVEDLLESDARIFVWPAAPGPPAPDVVKLPLGEPGAAKRLGAAFHRRIALRSPWLGALAIDGAAAGGPVVADVSPGSPADTAGVAVGDQVVAVDGIPVASRAALDERIAAAGLGATVDLGLRSAAGGERTATLRLGSSPWIRTDFGPGALDAVTYTDLELLAETAADDAWLVRASQALLLLRAGEAEEAARRLRSVGAPQSSHGVSQATVDYWLALALEATGSDYRDAARALLERAAGLPGARLYHADGAFLAPRARARVQSLEN